MLMWDWELVEHPCGSTVPSSDCYARRLQHRLAGKSEPQTWRLCTTNMSWRALLDVLSGRDMQMQAWALQAHCRGKRFRWCNHHWVLPATSMLAALAFLLTMMIWTSRCNEVCETLRLPLSFHMVYSSWYDVTHYLVAVCRAHKH